MLSLIFLPSTNADCANISNFSKHWSNPGSQYFWYQLVKNNATSHRPVITNFICMRRLWNQDKSSVVNLFKKVSSGEEFLDCSYNRVSNDVPRFLIEERVITIWARRLVVANTHQYFFYLKVCNRFNKIRFVIRRHERTISNNFFVNRGATVFSPQEFLVVSQKSLRNLLWRIWHWAILHFYKSYEISLWVFLHKSIEELWIPVWEFNVVTFCLLSKKLISASLKNLDLIV